jgi:hypothetical protein
MPLVYWQILGVVLIVAGTLIGGVATYLDNQAGERRVGELKVRDRELEARLAESTEARESLKKALEESNAARERIEEDLRPRALSRDQSSRLARELQEASSGGSASEPVVVASRMMDEESLAFSKQIEEVLRSNGWVVSHTPLSTHNFSGVAVFRNPPDDASSSLSTVVGAFTSAGLSVSSEYLDVKRTPIQRAPAVYIIVGHK